MQGIILGTENTGVENCCVMITLSKSKCIFMTILIFRFGETVVSLKCERGTCFHLEMTVLFFSKAINRWLLFPVVLEIYKHQTFIFISTRGQCVTFRFFFSISAKCIVFFFYLILSYKCNKVVKRFIKSKTKDFCKCMFYGKI